MKEARKEPPVKLFREYFEQGCLCIKNGSITKHDVSKPDEEALEYYEKNCKCSRNYT